MNLGPWCRITTGSWLACMVKHKQRFLNGERKGKLEHKFVLCSELEFHPSSGKAKEVKMRPLYNFMHMCESLANFLVLSRT